MPDRYVTISILAPPLQSKQTFLMLLYSYINRGEKVLSKYVSVEQIHISLPHSRHGNVFNEQHGKNTRRSIFISS